MPSGGLLGIFRKEAFEAVFHADFADGGEPVGEEDAVEVVDLVLEGAG